MEITPAPRVKACELPLEKLAGNSTLTESDKVAEVTRQFEAVLLRKILSEAQKPVFKSDAPGSAVCGDVYRDLMTNELADQISRSGIGVARSLQQQFQRQVPSEESATLGVPAPSVPASQRFRLTGLLWSSTDPTVRCASRGRRKP